MQKTGRGLVMTSAQVVSATGVKSLLKRAAPASQGIIRKPGPVMANFGGHAIPGTFFLILGIWLVVKHTVRHFWRSRHPKGQWNTPWFSKTADYLEGGLLTFGALVGILVEQFVPDGPHAHLYDAGNKSWVKLMNWQHSTMYMFFGISGIAMVVTTKSKMVPASLDRFTLTVALFVEGFLFYFHVHNRPPLDAHIHSLLLIAVFGGSATSMLEVFMRNHLILEMIRSGLFILQGSWFYQIGFVLYPLSGPQWDLTLHANIMFVTMCFCWHLAVSLLLVACTSAVVWFTLKRLSGKRQDIEIGLQKAENSQQALLESDEE